MSDDLDTLGPIRMLLERQEGRNEVGLVYLVFPPQPVPLGPLRTSQYALRGERATEPELDKQLLGPRPSLRAGVSVLTSHGPFEWTAVPPPSYSPGLHRQEDVAAAGQQLSFHLGINQADYLGQFHSETRLSCFFFCIKLYNRNHDFISSLKNI